MRRFGVWISAIGLVVAMTGCFLHYGFAGGGLPENVRTVAILPFDNQSTSAEVQSELFAHMRRELEQRLGVRDAPQDRADAVVRGVIQAYDADVPVGYSADPARSVTARRQLQITIDIEIVEQATGKVLFQQKGLRAQGEYAERAEAAGRKQAIERLVNTIIEGAQSQW